MKSLAAVSFCVFIYAQAAAAFQIVEGFDDLSHFDSGTAIWNQELGKIHPTLRVMNFTGAAPTGVDFSVGNGSDGPFDITTYSSFGSIVGQTIQLDTSVHSSLNVTHFSLAPGWTLQPIGSGQLIIRSLSYVDIQGTISCSGGNGGAGSGVTAGSAGAGHCGGANGGVGGGAGLSGANGSNIDPPTTGGQGGSFSAGASVGGGGGGSWNLTIAAGDGPNAPGSAGTSSSDPDFSQHPVGSAGGGGGGGVTANGGGGGGGGGGVVLIYAVGDVNIGTGPSSSTGFILVNGGRGGDGDVTAGPGGGGGGGSVQIFSGGTINIYNTNGIGASQARGGAGGTNGISAVGAAGAGGRSWFSAVNINTSVGSYTPLEQAGFSRGNIEFTDNTEFINTKSVDLGTSTHKILDMLLAPSSADFTIQLAGSDDDFAVDNTGFTSDPTIVSNKRYIKMQLTITTSNVNAPTMIDTAIVDVDSINTVALQKFQFQSAGCGRVEDVQTPKTNLFLFLLTPLLLLVLKLKSQRQLARQRSRIST